MADRDTGALAESFDHHDLAFVADSHPILAAIREQGSLIQGASPRSTGRRSSGAHIATRSSATPPAAIALAARSSRCL